MCIGCVCGDELFGGCVDHGHQVQLLRQASEKQRTKWIELSVIESAMGVNGYSRTDRNHYL